MNNLYAQDAQTLIERLIAFACKQYVMNSTPPRMWTEWTNLLLLHGKEDRHDEFIQAIEAFYNDHLFIGIDQGQTYLRYQLYLWLNERDDLMRLQDRLRSDLMEDNWAGLYIRSRIREDEDRWGLKEFAPVDEVYEEEQPELNYTPAIIVPDKNDERG